MLHKPSIFIFLLFVGANILAQAPNKLYFGEGVELDFSSGSPVYSDTERYYGGGSIAVATDEEGNIIFYFDGDAVYRANHTYMSGCSVIEPNPFSQSPFIVRKPDSELEYYLFYTDFDHNLWYAEVDMGLDGGNGELTQCGSVLYGNVIQGVQVVTHCDGERLWLISHSVGNGDYLAFLIDENGINEYPVISPVAEGLVFDERVSLAFDAISQRIAALAAIDGDSYRIEIVEVDRTNGVLSLEASYTNSDAIVTDPLQGSFSADGEQLYISATAEIESLDIATGIITTLYSGSFGHLTLGPDNRTYISFGWGNFEDFYVYAMPFPLAPWDELDEIPTDRTSAFGATNYYRPLLEGNVCISAPFSANSRVTQPICLGTGKIEILATGGELPHTYEWNQTALEGPIVENLEEGSYSVTITDAAGLEIINNFALETGNELIASITTQATPAGANEGSAQLDIAAGEPPFVIVWQTDPLQYGNVATGLAAGEYQVEIYDVDLCEFTLDFNVEILSNTTAISEDERVDLFPTLTHDFISLITSETTGQKEYRIIGTNGQQLLAGTFSTDSERLNVSGLSHGTYFLQLICGGEMYVGRFVKY